MFDREFGTRTSGKVVLRRLRIPSRNKSEGVDYEPVDPVTFAQAMQYVSPDGTFIDLGCGKGRGLILAHRAGFRKLIGIEFSRALAKVARKNLSALGIHAEIVECDATAFQFPQENCVVYLYNPFGRSVVHEIVPKLRGIVIYINPVHKSEFSALPVIHENHAFMVYGPGAGSNQTLSGAA